MKLLEKRGNVRLGWNGKQYVVWDGETIKGDTVQRHNERWISDQHTAIRRFVELSSIDTCEDIISLLSSQAQAYKQLCKTYNI